MKALVCRKFGSFDDLSIDDIADPIPSDRQVRIAVVEAGVNFGDALITAGQYQIKPSFPFSPGMEAAGIVVDVGADVKKFKPGDRVMATCVYGGFAEEICVDQSVVFPVENGVSFTTAAVFPICYGTARHALVDCAAIKPGEWLLVLGAGSGVALTTIELATMAGARVIAAASSAQKLQAAKLAGAEATINYQEELLRPAVAEITNGRGVHAVFDPVGGDMSEHALRTMAPGGRCLIVGFAAGRFPSIPANLLLLKEWSVIGVNTAVLIERNPTLYRSRFAEMMQWAAKGEIKPLVARRYPLVRAVEALTAVTSRDVVGRITVVIRDKM
ncbi:NADPH:quinone oxidoreductase family protein [Bradyrhizobium sp. 1]|uniref:NADPH:quinone oxidoreductase family protein n=1 Tax=Bradyrhizobium sp. 1 TaxID=241591 RepID=UPI001FFAFE61|nr:NADPH:quinone oxidoreductase family protein [Bradyrhizobium sp. 1]MCK1394514.1 NADPH:quinone oxidoreductase family protein [Bradyrhizobium sp. 1]